MIKYHQLTNLCLLNWKKSTFTERNFTWRGDNFTQALLVMLVTNIKDRWKYSSRSRLKNYLQQPQNAQKANKAKMEKCQFVELKIFTSVRVLDTWLIILNAGYDALWGENPCLSSGGDAGCRSKGTGLLWRISWAAGDDNHVPSYQNNKSLLFPCHLLLPMWKWYLRWRAMMSIREPGTAGSTVAWASGLGTVSQHLFQILCCLLIVLLVWKTIEHSCEHFVDIILETFYSGGFNSGMGKRAWNSEYRKYRKCITFHQNIVNLYIIQSYNLDLDLFKNDVHCPRFFASFFSVTNLYF